MHTRARCINEPVGASTPESGDESIWVNQVFSIYVGCGGTKSIRWTGMWLVVYLKARSARLKGWCDEIVIEMPSVSERVFWLPIIEHAFLFVKLKFCAPKVGMMSATSHGAVVAVVLIENWFQVILMTTPEARCQFHLDRSREFHNNRIIPRTFR